LENRRRYINFEKLLLLFFLILRKADLVAFQFSLEHRLLKESCLLKECSTGISSSVKELDRLVVQLQAVKPDDPNYNYKCNAIIMQIIPIRHSITLLTQHMEKLLLSQANSIERFSKRTVGLQTNPQHSEERESENQQNDLVSVNECESSEITNDRSIFENEVQETLEDNFFMSRDEVFELKVSVDDDEHADLNSSCANNELNKEMRAIQAELMAQLRGSLSTRRADMEAREAQAYLESYGKLPDNQEGDLLLERSSLRSQFRASAEMNKNCQEPSTSRNIEITDPETFGDELEESDDQDEEMKSIFRASLQELLRKRGGC